MLEYKYLKDKSNKIIKTVENEIFLTADKNLSIFDYPLYINAVRSNLGIDVMRLYILNDDETIKEDVTSYVLDGSCSYNYQQGQTHSLNLTLINDDGFWSDEPINGNISSGTKFRLDVGKLVNGVTYWRKCGVFVLKDITFNGTPTQTVSLILYDKFSLFDKTFRGNIESDFKIPVGTNLIEAIDMCVHYDFGNGRSVDEKSVIYESDLSSVVTPYTITKSPNTSMGDVMVELANMVSHDIFYNENGNLTLRPGSNGVSYDENPIQWYYDDKVVLDYTEPCYNINYGSVINKIIVRGAILNGYQYKGVASNDNPFSRSNINLNLINTECIEDSNITSDELALERAKYELSKRLISYTKNSFKSIFIPHLRPMDVVAWTCPEFNIYNEKYVIQSLSFPILGGFYMNVEMSNVKEVSLRG